MVECGYRVLDGTARLGVPAHSLGADYSDQSLIVYNDACLGILVIQFVSIELCQTQLDEVCRPPARALGIATPKKAIAGILEGTAPIRVRSQMGYSA